MNNSIKCIKCFFSFWHGSPKILNQLATLIRFKACRFYHEIGIPYGTILKIQAIQYKVDRWKFWISVLGFAPKLSLMRCFHHQRTTFISIYLQVYSSIRFLMIHSVYFCGTDVFSAAQGNEKLFRLLFFKGNWGSFELTLLVLWSEVDLAFGFEIHAGHFYQLTGFLTYMFNYLWINDLNPHEYSSKETGRLCFSVRGM